MTDRADGFVAEATQESFANNVTDQLADAKVLGEKLDKLPEELYIPPGALIVFLEAFQGPLDLLLYLIRKNNLDILNIPVADVTEQYTKYIDLMQTFRLDLAGDYLVMAATLATLKSQMMLPRQPEIEDEEDPRAELARRLLEYEVFKRAAESLDELPRRERDIHVAAVTRPEVEERTVFANVELRELIAALSELMAQAKFYSEQEFPLEGLSVRERMTEVLDRVSEADGYLTFESLFDVTEGKVGVVVTFLALLELLRNSLIGIVQRAQYAPLYVTQVSPSNLSD